jgi:hypothetical protein
MWGANMSEWRRCMSKSEVEFCDRQLYKEITEKNFFNISGVRAARADNAHQLKEFNNIGKFEKYHSFVVRRWSWREFGFRYYLLGFYYEGRIL